MNQNESSVPSELGKRLGYGGGCVEAWPFSTVQQTEIKPYDRASVAGKCKSKSGISVWGGFATGKWQSLTTPSSPALDHPRQKKIQQPAACVRWASTPPLTLRELQKLREVVGSLKMKKRKTPRIQHHSRTTILRFDVINIFVKF